MQVEQLEDTFSELLLRRLIPQYASHHVQQGLTQFVPSGVQPVLHGAQGHLEDSGNFLLPVPAQVVEDDGLTQGRGEFADRRPDFLL